MQRNRWGGVVTAGSRQPGSSTEAEALSYYGAAGCSDRGEATPERLIVGLGQRSCPTPRPCIVPQYAAQMQLQEGGALELLRGLRPESVDGVISGAMATRDPQPDD